VVRIFFVNNYNPLFISYESEQNICDINLVREKKVSEIDESLLKPKLVGGSLTSCVDDNYSELNGNRVSVDYQYKISPKKALYDLCCLLGLDLPHYVVTENYDGIVGFGCTLALMYKEAKFVVSEPNRYKNRLIVENLCSQRMLFSLHEADPGKIPKPVICNDYQAILWDYCVSEGIRVPEYKISIVGIVHRTYECRILFKDKMFISRGHALTHVSQECARRILEYYELSCDLDWRHILEVLCKRMKIERLEFKEDYSEVNTVQILCMCGGKKYMSTRTSKYSQAMKYVVQQVILDIFFEKEIVGAYSYDVDTFSEVSLDYFLQYYSIHFSIPPFVSSSYAKDSIPNIYDCFHLHSYVVSSDVFFEWEIGERGRNRIIVNRKRKKIE